eukprot:CAMPEP_0203744294 /NCGR_PEP_ID=MMETSP0098-20131031/410_1 /ASSEMBLY_ACC=CAM_ASM_000208 /TAXON_ID=96639 /ORGANISM=" , Strain NY0313808BC1" /LENGTH=896 /DNA_ID=CAMNT_0050631777 /DNA_START=410 /DNA_END=3100 /DNA_ORIENTATION=+
MAAPPRPTRAPPPPVQDYQAVTRHGHLQQSGMSQLDIFEAKQREATEKVKEIHHHHHHHHYLPTEVAKTIDSPQDKLRIKTRGEIRVKVVKKTHSSPKNPPLLRQEKAPLQIPEPEAEAMCETEESLKLKQFEPSVQEKTKQLLSRASTASSVDSVDTQASTPLDVAPAPTPLDVAPAPTPLDVAPAPTPLDVAPAPTPLDAAPAPTPLDVSPAPTPLDVAPAPTTLDVAPAPTPLDVTPAPTPLDVTPAPTPLDVARTLPAPEDVIHDDTPSSSRRSSAIPAIMEIPPVVLLQDEPVEITVEEDQKNQTLRRRRGRTASVVLSEVEAETVSKTENCSHDSGADGEDEDADAEDGGVQKSHVDTNEAAGMSQQGFVLLAEAMTQEGDDEDDAYHDENIETKEEDKQSTQQVEAERRGSMLMVMLEQAEDMQEEPLPLVPFGNALRQQAERMKPQLGSKKSTLPKYTSEVEENPSRPAAKVKEPHMKTRQGRAHSQGDRAPPKEAIHKEGWLLKQPRQKSSWLGAVQNSKHWKPRYFKLSGRLLLYMKSADSKAPKRMLDLANVEIDTNPKNLGFTPTVHAMRVYEKGRKNQGFKICAKNFKDIMSWYKAIVSNAVFLCFCTNPSLPPQDHTPLSPEQKRVLEEKKARALLPKPKQPKAGDFYPLYQKEASYYDLLGVPADAPKKVIRKSFYKLAASYHPDKNPDADPHEFARLAQAYDVLFDDTLREKYDLGEKIKEVLRRGFDCVMYIPTSFVYHGKAKVPSMLEGRKVTVFTDGEILNLYRQPAATDEKFSPLQPDVSVAHQLRFVQRVIYGRNDPIMYNSFIAPAHASDPEADIKGLDSFVVMQGAKLEHDVYIQFDNPAACKELVDGLRIIRSEKSVLFAQTLEKLFAEGYD